MLNRLKSVYPLNEIVRIIDLTFSRFDDLSRRLDLLDHSIRKTAESETELMEHWQRSETSLRQELQALSEKHNDIAENDVILMKTVTCVIETLRKVQASQTQIQLKNSSSEGNVTHSLEVLNDHLRDVLVRARQREAELLDKVQDFQLRLTGVKNGASDEHFQVAQALSDLGEQDTQIHNMLVLLSHRNDELHTTVKGLRGAFDQAAALAAEQQAQTSRAAVDELRRSFQDATEKAAALAAEQQAQTSRAAVDELRRSFQDAMEKAAALAAEQQAQTSRAAVDELRRSFQDAMEKATALAAEQQTQTSRAAVDELRRSFQDAMEKATALAAEQQTQTSRAAVDELRRSFQDAMEKATALAAEQQARTSRAAVDELRRSFQDAMEKATALAAEQQTQTSRAAVDELRGSFQEAIEKAATLAAEQQTQTSRAAVDELRGSFQEALEKAAGAYLLPRMDGLQQTILAKLDDANIHLDTTQFDVLNPDVRLLEYLYSYITCPVAVDIGANIGEVSERLLRAGYHVYAYEPFPPVFEQLTERLANRRDFHPHQLAVGFVDRAMDLHIATDRSSEGKYKETTTLYSSLVRHSMLEDLQFTHKIKVAVRSVESLQNSGELPKDIGVMKIDTEGYDLEVIRGMASCRPSVLMAEFWDPRMAFGRSGAINLLEELVSEMREREYRWYVVIYRLDGRPTSYFCNQPLSPPNSWGNVLFFWDRGIFMEALQWCSTVLPPTYF